LVRLDREREKVREREEGDEVEERRGGGGGGVLLTRPMLYKLVPEGGSHTSPEAE
jgi:hypothetical protein